VFTVIILNAPDVWRQRSGRADVPRDRRTRTSEERRSDFASCTVVITVCASLTEGQLNRRIETTKTTSSFASCLYIINFVSFASTCKYSHVFVYIYICICVCNLVCASNLLSHNKSA
jgi:hypothetical protein